MPSASRRHFSEAPRFIIQMPMILPLLAILSVSCETGSYLLTRVPASGCLSACVTVTNSYFCDLSGSDAGGAICLDDGGDASMIELSTFVRCRAEAQGGAVDSGQLLTIASCCATACEVAATSNGRGSFVYCHTV